MTLHRRTFLTRLFGLGAGLVGRPEIARAQEGAPVASPAPAVTPAADQLVWFLDRLNAGDLEETAVVDRFAPAYLALIASGAPVPTNDVVARVRRLAAELGPVVLQDFPAPPQ